MDDFVTLVLEFFYNPKNEPHRKKEFKDWELREDLLYYKGKVYAASTNEIRRKIIEVDHASITAGHPGQAKTLGLIKQTYRWPSMKTMVNKYVDSCDTCQRIKPINRLPRGELQPLEAPSEPWEHVSCDFIVKLPLLNGYDSILIVVDYFTKMAHFIPTREDIDAKGVAELFLNYVWKLHGTPKSVVSDRGSVFTSKFLTELYRLMDIKPHLSTAYRPQTDGQTEWVNQTIKG